jgi:NAD(P)-dependent dehydrogenase (short-subunit alcohol dehydrogenase family)
MGEPLVGVAAVLGGEPPRRSVFAPGQFLLTDKIAMVTGAQRNIGLDMALVLAEAGATVYCMEGGTGKGRLEYIPGDVSDQKQIWGIAEEIVRREGGLDICFANAGVMGGVYCLDYTAEDAREVREVNFTLHTRI